MQVPLRLCGFLVACLVACGAASSAAGALDAAPDDLRARGGLAVFIGGAEDLAPGESLL